MVVIKRAEGVLSHGEVKDHSSIFALGVWRVVVLLFVAGFDDLGEGTVTDR